ncbi:MAG: hypothetical protein IJ565_02200 [Bacilli bacterium]|nr:hypothetical protein [Bacilli bacterium]
MNYNITKDEFGYTYYVVNNNIVFKMFIGANGDLYWTINDLDNMEDELDKLSIEITKDNIELYNLFDELYNEIANCEVFKINDIEDELEDVNTNDYYVKMNNDIRKNSSYKELYDGEKITWISDDKDREKYSMTTITKMNDSFLIDFKTREQDNIEDGYMPYLSTCIAVRFRNSGSYYNPFNIIFMRMYNKLKDIDFENKTEKEYVLIKK